MEECSFLLNEHSENIRSGHGGRSVTGRIKKNRLASDFFLPEGHQQHLDYFHVCIQLNL
jgi:hypothetical protein